jgi:hypothetical protein
MKKSLFIILSFLSLQNFAQIKNSDTSEGNFSTVALDQITGKAANAQNIVSVSRNTSTNGVINSSDLASNPDFSTESESNSIAIEVLDFNSNPDLAVDNRGKKRVSLLNNVALFTNANLSNLSISSATLTPTFNAATIVYGANVENNITSITVTPTLADAIASVKINGNTAVSGSASSAIALNFGDNSITVAVTAQDGTTTKTYTITVTRALPPPTITSFTPISDIVGSTINITGTNFNATATNNVVYFGAVKALVTAATATSLSVTVPVGANYSIISALNTSNGLIGHSKTHFNQIFTPSKATISNTDFATPVNFIGTGQNGGIVKGDIDGDGKIDIICTNYANVGSFSVLRNTSAVGIVSFATKVDITTLQWTTHVAIGDMNGDGKLDVIISNLYNSSVSVFINTSTSGNISFAPKVDFAVGTNPTTMVVGDLDGDGKLDIIVNISNSTSVAILRNTTNGGTVNFATATNFTTGLATYLALSDIDGDGKPDLISQYGSNSSVFRNTSTVGSIDFSSAANFAIGGTPNCNIGVGDFDGDGKLDLVFDRMTVSGVVKSSVLRNTSSTGSIGFDAAQLFLGGGSLHISVADYNGDGKPDLVTDGAIAVPNTSTVGNISFGAFVQSPNGGWGSNFVDADIDGDGRPDFATVESGGGSNAFRVTRNTTNLSANADLSNLLISSGTLTPTFIAATISYTANVANNITSITVTPTAANATATLKINNNTVISGSASSAIALNVGTNTITLAVTAQDGTTTKTYTITFTRNAVLPIVLVDYQAKLQNNSEVKLTWSSASEQNNDYYELLRSTDGKTFISLGKVKGQGTTSQQNYYSFVDITPKKGTNYYKLLQMDRDGKTTELGIKSVSFDFKAQLEVAVYPNPSSSVVNVEFEANQFIYISVIDLAGKVIIKKEITETQSKISLNIADLPASNYIIKLQGKKGVKIKQLVTE